MLVTVIVSRTGKPSSAAAAVYVGVRVVPFVITPFPFVVDQAIVPFVAVASPAVKV